MGHTVYKGNKKRRRPRSYGQVMIAYAYLEDIEMRNEKFSIFHVLIIIDGMSFLLKNRPNSIKIEESGNFVIIGNMGYVL